MYKKIILSVVLSQWVISCGNEPNVKKPSLTTAPQFAQIKHKVVNSVGVQFGSEKVIVSNAFDGKKVRPCGKTNISESNEKNTATKTDCSVKILNSKENQEFLDLLARIESFNKQNTILIERNGKIQKVAATIITMANYEGSCGSLTNVGGSQYESDVECFTPQQQQCASWVANGWTFVKDYPPCYQYYH